MGIQSEYIYTNELVIDIINKFMTKYNLDKRKGKIYFEGFLSNIINNYFENNKVQGYCCLASLSNEFSEPSYYKHIYRHEDYGGSKSKSFYSLRLHETKLKNIQRIDVFDTIDKYIYILDLYQEHRFDEKTIIDKIREFLELQQGE